LYSKRPFFFYKDIKKKIFQQTNRLKYEIQLYLPYEKKWSAVASINNHLETMTKAYNIKFRNKKSISSGCIGIGYERLIYAIYSQKGIINNLWKKKF
jgi:seryl-tRNA synthetase